MILKRHSSTMVGTVELLRLIAWCSFWNPSLHAHVGSSYICGFVEVISFCIDFSLHATETFLSHTLPFKVNFCIVTIAYFAYLFHIPLPPPPPPSLKYSNSAAELLSDSVAHLVRAGHLPGHVCLSHFESFFLKCLSFSLTLTQVKIWLSGLEHVKILSLIRLTLCAHRPPPSLKAVWLNVTLLTWVHATVMSVFVVYTCCSLCMHWWTFVKGLHTAWMHRYMYMNNY